MSIAETQMKSALRRAGVNVDDRDLRQAVLDTLKKHHMNVDRAVPTWIQAVRGEPRLMELAARFVLQRFAEEMSGDGQNMNDHQDCHAAARQPNGADVGHSCPANLASRAGAAPTDRGGTGRPHIAAHVLDARPVREPTAAQRSAMAQVAKSVTVTVLDTYRIRDGRVIGDIRFGELERLRSANAQEASLIRQIQRHATAGHDQRVRDVIKAEELQRMIQRAAEVADAA